MLAWKLLISWRHYHRNTESRCWRDGMVRPRSNEEVSTPSRLRCYTYRIEGGNLGSNRRQIRHPKETMMHKALLSTDGSDSAFQAATYLVDFIGKHGPIEVHVANIQPRPLEWQTHGMEKEAIHEHLEVEAHLAMKSVLHALNKAGITCQTHIKLGDTAETLVALAEELGCDHIVMGTRGLGAISGIVLGSVTRKVLHLANVPVTCVKGQALHR